MHLIAGSAGFAWSFLYKVKKVSKKDKKYIWGKTDHANPADPARLEVTPQREALGVYSSSRYF